MDEALILAHRAFHAGEVPIGCVIVHDGRIISKGQNLRRTKKNVIFHAEMIAICAACEVMGDWRLEGCSLYVTLEPCPMCAGAIVQARIDEVIFGAKSPKAGCAGSVMNILDCMALNHQAVVRSGIREQECARLMQDFFDGLRGGHGKKPQSGSIN